MPPMHNHRALCVADPVNDGVAADPEMLTERPRERCGAGLGRHITGFFAAVRTKACCRLADSFRLTACTSPRLGAVSRRSKLPAHPLAARGTYQRT